MRPTLVALCLAASLPARADTAAGSTEMCSVDVGSSTREVGLGQRGRLVVVLRPRRPWHIDPRAPLRIRLDRPAGLSIDRVDLGRKDAVDPAALEPRFETGFAATSAGTREVAARLDFFVCSETACARQARTVKIPVTVR